MFGLQDWSSLFLGAFVIQGMVLKQMKHNMMACTEFSIWSSWLPVVYWSKMNVSAQAFFSVVEMLPL